MESKIFKNLGYLKLWQVRHSEVMNKIQASGDIRYVLDLGTSEATLIQKLQRGTLCKKLVGIDIDTETLKKATFNLIPDGIEHDRIYNRQFDQTVQLYKGSALVKYPQLKKENFDLITLVEVIEHIEQQRLPQLNQNVFGYLRPKWVWVSTPNIEFNSLFNWDNRQGLQQKFRHDDHKFQWTREQFKEYVDEICQKYGYEAQITGVGQAFNQKDHLEKGFCTQIAIFNLKNYRKDQNDNKMDLETSCFEPIYSDKEQSFQVEIPLQLVEEHINYSWKSKIKQLLQVAMHNVVLRFGAQGFIGWEQIFRILGNHKIFNKVMELTDQQINNLGLRDFIFGYFKKVQIFSSENTSDNDNQSNLESMDAQFMKERQEWTSGKKEQHYMIEESDYLLQKKQKLPSKQVTLYSYDQNFLLKRTRSIKKLKVKSDQSDFSKMSQSSIKSKSSKSQKSRKHRKYSNDSKDSKNSKKSTKSKDSKNIKKSTKSKDSKNIKKNTKSKNSKNSKKSNKSQNDEYSWGSVENFNEQLKQNVPRGNRRRQNLVRLSIKRQNNNDMF